MSRTKNEQILYDTLMSVYESIESNRPPTAAQVSKLLRKSMRINDKLSDPELERAMIDLADCSTASVTTRRSNNAYGPTKNGSVVKVKMNAGHVVTVDRKFRDILLNGCWEVQLNRGNRPYVRRIHKDADGSGVHGEEFGRAVVLKMKRGMKLANGKRAFCSHLDNDGLNCTKANLAIVECSKVCSNRRKSIGAIKYKGVTRTRKGKFFAYITSKGKLYRLGIHDTPQEAALARDFKALELHGQHAIFNTFCDSELEEICRRDHKFKYVAMVAAARLG